MYVYVILNNFDEIDFIYIFVFIIIVFIILYVFMINLLVMMFY